MSSVHERHLVEIKISRMVSAYFISFKLDIFLMFIFVYFVLKLVFVLVFLFFFMLAVVSHHKTLSPLDWSLQIVIQNVKK